MFYVFRNGTFSTDGFWFQDTKADNPIAAFDVEFPWQYDDRDREWANIPTPVLEGMIEDRPDRRFLFYVAIGRGCVHEETPIFPYAPKNDTMGALVGPPGTGKSAFLANLKEVYPPGALKARWIEANEEKQIKSLLTTEARRRGISIAGCVFPFVKPFTNLSGLKAEMPWIMVKSVKAYQHFTHECAQGRNPMPL